MFKAKNKTSGGLDFKTMSADALSKFIVHNGCGRISILPSRMKDCWLSLLSGNRNGLVSGVERIIYFVPGFFLDYRDMVASNFSLVGNDEREKIFCSACTADYARKRAEAAFYIACSPLLSEEDRAFLAMVYRPFLDELVKKTAGKNAGVKIFKAVAGVKSPGTLEISRAFAKEYGPAASERRRSSRSAAAMPEEFVHISV